MLGDFCTMVVLHGWVLGAHQDAREEYLLCMELLFEAHDDTFAWAKNLQKHLIRQVVVYESK